YPFSQDIEYKYGAPGQKGAGQVVYKKDETGETHYKYGELNEVIKETRTINRYEAVSSSETASFEYRSDYLGRMQSMKYPDGETITYTYDKGGQLKGVSGEKTTNKGSIKYSYVDKILYDEHAQRVYIKYGNGVETRYKYDEKRRWLDTIETKNNQTQDVFQKIKYSFDPVGNVLGYNNDASTYETSQSYTYDNLYQLISVEGTSNQYKGKKSFGATPVSIAKYKQTFSFDAIGNMKEKLSTTNIPGSQGNSYPKAELDYSLDYEYDPAYAHRLIHAGTRYYRYDANGNITAEKDGPFTDEEEFTFTYSYFENEDVYGADYGFGLDAPKETEQTNPQDLFAYRRNYTWNERNLLTKSSDRNFTVHYRYGDDGQRALKYTDEGRSETLYFNNFFTIHIPTQDQNNPQGLRVHKHIFVGNSRLVTAMTHTDNSGDNEEQKVKRYYYHSDHLGSAQFVTDWKGRQYEHIEYTPYGELWIEEVAAGLDKLPFRFTGKELDEETGLYYYGARYLDPKYSRWLSGDPALGEYIPSSGTDPSKLAGMGGVFNVVNLHVYHYAGNNPIKYVDPDGRSTWIDQDGLVRNVINDGDLNIYQWSGNGVYENIEGPLSKESVIDNENPWKVVGETLFWDAFISPDTNKPVGKLILGESIDAYIDDLHAKAESYGKDKTFRLSLPNKEFDIKTQYPGHEGFSYHGFLFHGKYVTLREAGNILAGMNAALFGMEFDDFQKGAGALHAKGLWGVGMYKVFGSVYGPAPKYGENDYQYTRSLYGYNIILRSK
ncbi:RHS repeat domain-containing protein, partial [Treponema putidum]